MREKHEERAKTGSIVETCSFCIHHLAHLHSHVHDPTWLWQWSSGSTSTCHVELSSLIWDQETRCRHAEVSLRACVSVCVWPCECRPWAYTRFRQERKEKKRNFIFCGSDITRHWENKALSSKKYYPGGCVFSGSRWEDTLTKSGPLPIWHLSTDCIFERWRVWFSHKSSLFSHIYTILSAQTSMLLLDYYYHSTSAHTNRPVLAHTLLEVYTNVVCCHEPHTWKVCTMTLISNHCFSLVLLPVFSWLLTSWRISVHQCSG